MQVKDYYKILEVSPGASQTDIKKSYRRLALKYHPDKNFGNQLYEAKFKEILEAYHILSDIKKRNDYNFKRNYTSYTDQTKKKTYTVTTPQTILNQTIDFRRKVAVLDPDRMNKVALFQQIQHLLSRPNISILKEYNDTRINKKIIDEILYCSRNLPFVYVEKICFQLTALAGTDNVLYHRIYNFSKQVRLKNYWNKYKLIVAIIVSLIVCFIMYKVSTEIM